jgi:hypothetical protein
MIKAKLKLTAPLIKVLKEKKHYLMISDENTSSGSEVFKALEKYKVLDEIGDDLISLEPDR